MYMMIGYKNDGKSENNFTVMNYYTGKTEELREKELCDLIKEGKVMEFDNYKGWQHKMNEWL